jgi:tetratricopeptide (TPR) repeat protein
MVSSQPALADRLRPAVMAAGAIVLALCLYGMQPRLRMWKDSLALWEAAGAANPGSALVHLNWGQALEEKGDERGAVEHYRRALELDPREYMALFNLARLTTRHGRHQEALELLHRIPEGAPAYPSAQKLATEVFIKLGNAAAALQSLEGGRENDPDVLFQKAGLLASQAQFEEAAALYQRVLGVNPQMHAARLNFGKCKLEVGDYHAARRALADIPESAPEHLDALFTLGNVEAALGNVDAAVLAFEKVLEKDPGHAYALFNLVAIYEQTGQAGKADALRPRLRDVKPPQ